MSNNPERDVYEFAEFRLLAAQRRLVARTDGRPIDLTHKAFDALLYLVRHPGELLDKATLLEAIWPNVVVEENSLNQVISTLRRALADGHDGQRLIVTVPGRGYQLVAEVRVDDDRVAADRARAPAPGPAAQTSTGPAHLASIAVLPFASLSSDPEKDYFGDGIADELIHLLSRVPGLKVPARTSSFAYKGRNIDVRQIARDLGVAMLLEGTVRSAGDNIRVTAQLVDAQSGYHIWSQTFDRQFAYVFQLQDELAGAIIRQLEPNFGGFAHSALRVVPPTRNVEAYRLYLQACALYFRAGNTPDQIERLSGMLERAIALDPQFARAHALSGSAHYHLLQFGVRGDGALDEATTEAERALALDPTLAEAYVLLGSLQAARGKWCEAAASFGRAIALDPRDPAAHLTYAMYCLASTGQLRDAIAQALHSYQLAPGRAVAAGSLAGLYSLAGQDDEMAEFLRVVSDLDGPPQAPVPIFRSEAARRAGRYGEAANFILAVLPAEVTTAGGEDVVKLLYRAFGDVSQKSAARSALRGLSARLDARSADAWPMTVLMLHWHALLGEIDDAYVVAQRIVTRLEQSRPLVTVNLPPIWKPELAEFRSDPRFREFTNRLGLIEYWNAHGPPDGYRLEQGHLVAREKD